MTVYTLETVLRSIAELDTKRAEYERALIETIPTLKESGCKSESEARRVLGVIEPAKPELGAVTFKVESTKSFHDHLFYYGKDMRILDPAEKCSTVLLVLKKRRPA